MRVDPCIQLLKDIKGDVISAGKDKISYKKPNTKTELLKKVSGAVIGLLLMLTVSAPIIVYIMLVTGSFS